MSSNGTPDRRPFVGAWTFRFGFSVVLFSYGLSVDPNRTRGRSHEWQRNWRPVKVFRNYAYRGFRA